MNDVAEAEKRKRIGKKKERRENCFNCEILFFVNHFVRQTSGI